MNIFKYKPTIRLTAAALIFLAGGFDSRGQEMPSSDTPDSPQARGGFAAQRGVYKAHITPHWLTNNMQFWYRNDLRDGAKEFVFVDAGTGIRRPAFDHEKLAASLSKSSGQEFKAAVIRGLLDAGVDVVDIGLVSTDMLYKLM